MNNNCFFIDSELSQTISYSELLDDLNKLEEIPKFICSKNFYEIFLFIIASIINNSPVTLLDYDLSDKELQDLVPDENITEKYKLTDENNIDGEKLFNSCLNSSNWELTLYTSGTTGIPKKVTHNVKSLTRMVKTSPKYENSIWGFAYNPTHIAGIQVFFQAFLNKNTIIKLFGLRRDVIYDLIEKYCITNISATPTFYRMLLPVEKEMETVRSISVGGEKLDDKLTKQLKDIFPQAKILNIFASTEAGSLFASDGDIFTIKQEVESYIKIENNEIYVHKDFLGESDSFQLVGEWYNTGDEIEIVSENPLSFRIIGRKNEMVNVGGYKVNPLEIEELLNSHPRVIISKVYSKKNSVLGSMLFADVKSNGDITEKELREFLSENLQSFKIPRIINFVKEIELTRTGKLKRI
jgi:acyl-coenzyme A synthetase/AMP-(fatty) acid ligase